MKNLFFLLFPLISFAQSINIDLLNQDFSNAMDFQNSIRAYYGYDPLDYSKELSLKAEVAIEDYIDDTSWLNTKIALIYIRSKDEFKLKFDYFTDAIIAWTVDTNLSENNTTIEQVLCKNCENVGFAIKAKGDMVYVVAKYDDY